ncbi:MAG TPA: glycerophosphodiester phosphodiesterase family protein, partial [Polyangiaceae bacterium]|nr:glycerophosphodiester phosphodiesterase family protein [Polyangiaceae bacterium]
MAKKLALWGIGLLLLGMLVGRVIMGLLCSDAKPSEGPGAAAVPFFAGLPKVLNLAHRGASKQAPEHSLQALSLALSAGADVLELDLRATRDRQLVTSHDATLERTLGLPQRWSEITWAEAQALAPGRLPPLLGEVLARFPQAHLNLELKDDDPAVARLLAEQIAAAAAEQRVLVASMHADVLREFRRASLNRVASSASFREALRFFACYRIGQSCNTEYAALQLPVWSWLGITSAEFLRHAH